MIKPLNDVLARLQLFPSMDPVQRILVLVSMPVMLLVFSEFRRRMELATAAAAQADDFQRELAHSLMIEWICMAELAYLLLLAAFALRGCGLLKTAWAPLRHLLTVAYFASLAWTGYSLLNHALWAADLVHVEWIGAGLTHYFVLGWVLLSAVLWSLDARGRPHGHDNTELVVRRPDRDQYFPARDNKQGGSSAKEAASAS